jgi:hypothetical protein
MLKTFYALNSPKRRAMILLELAKLDIVEGGPEAIWGPKLAEGEKLAMVAQLSTAVFDQLCLRKSLPENEIRRATPN